MSTLAFVTLLLTAVAPVARAACVADAWEQDDACQTAPGFLFSGASQSRTFCDDATDWVTFEGCPGRSYTIATSSLETSADTVIDLFAPDCTTLLASDDDGGGGKASQLVWLTSAAGAYHVRIRQKDGTSGDNRGYVLTLTGDTSPCETTSRDFAAPNGTSARELTGLAAATDGGVFLVGSYQASPGIDNAWVLRLSADGSTAWQKAYASSLDQFTPSIRLNASGEIFIAGQQTDTSTGSSWGYVAKLDASGNIGWQSRIGSGDDYFNDVVPLSDGGAIAAGLLTSGNDTDGWLVRLSSTGALTWSKKYGGNSADAFHSLAAAPDGNFVAAGPTYSSGAGAPDILIAKVDASGALVWQKTLGESGDDDVSALAVAADGSVFVGGYVEDPPGERPGLIAKLDAAGTILWQREIREGAGVFGAIQIKGIAPLADGGIAVNGAYVGSNGGWFARLDAVGNIVWQVHYRGLDFPAGAVATPDGGSEGVASAQGGGVARFVRFDASGAIASCNALQAGAATSSAAGATLANGTTTAKAASVTPVSAALTASAQSTVATDYCPCSNPTFFGALYVDKFGSTARISWGAEDGVDIVRGDLPTLLSSGGDFTAALNAIPNASLLTCAASADTQGFVDDYLVPDAGKGYFFLGRAAHAICPGTYDESQASQSGSRDWEIHLAAYDCPP